MANRMLIERDGGVVHVRMNRPEKKNALNGELFDGLRSTARTLATDPSARCVVLSGAGGCFCSGLDFASFAAMAEGNLDAETQEVAAIAKDLSRDGANGAQQIAWLWQELSVPVIAAIEGVAYGGGLHVALGADIRIVSPDARLAFVEIIWGLVPDLSGTQALRRLVPLDLAKKLILTGDVITGEQAVAMNLCTELSDAPIESALELAHRIARRSPDAVRAAKQLLNESGRVSLSDGLANEFRASGSLMGTPNQIEAVIARLGKCAPNFVDPI
jgi:enoyl-CoA hydratase/carnithine racemase